MNNKLLFIAVIALHVCSSAVAVPITITDNALSGMIIPDDDLNGLASTITLSTPISQITDVQVSINISGGFNGDYYAYLQYNSGLVVLLNNLGSSQSNPYGSPGGGFTVTFTDASANVSTAFVAPGASLSGTWAPQVGSLAAFAGMNPNGDWTLFIADKSPGGVGTFESWSLKVTGEGVTAVPDGGNTLQLLVFGLAALAFCYRHHRHILKKS